MMNKKFPKREVLFLVVVVLFFCFVFLHDGTVGVDLLDPVDYVFWTPIVAIC